MANVTKCHNNCSEMLLQFIRLLLL